MSMAQNPKMYIKAYGGFHDHYFVYRAENTLNDHFVGYAFGAGFRVSYKKIFGEIDFDFIRTGIIFQFDSTNIPELDNAVLEFRFNAFELPIVGGFIPVKTPLFKWYLYTGPVQRFNTRGKINFLGEEIRFKPREVNLPFYNLDWRFGTQVDIAFFNIDFRYSIGVTNSVKEDIRTNSHEFSLVFGMIF
jgi:hypothetical protein